jgi:hypothetical protein
VEDEDGEGIGVWIYWVFQEMAKEVRWRGRGTPRRKTAKRRIVKEEDNDELHKELRKRIVRSRRGCEEEDCHDEKKEGKRRGNQNYGD